MAYIHTPAYMKVWVYAGVSTLEIHESFEATLEINSRYLV